MLEAEGKERQLLGLKQGNTPVVPALGERDKHPRSAEIAAKIIGVSHGNITEAKRIAKVAPEKLEDTPGKQNFEIARTHA